MARVPQVTRTIQTTTAKIMCLDITKGESLVKEIVLPRTYKNEKDILKHAEKEICDTGIKVVHVIETAVQNTLYGMTEQEFIKTAKILPPRNIKAKSETETPTNN